MKTLKLLTALLMLSSSCLFAQYQWKHIPVFSARNIEKDFFNNKIWITGSGGLFQYNVLKKEWNIYTTAQGLSKLWTWSVTSDSDVIWVGTETGGANLIYRQSDTTLKFLQYSDRSNYMPTVMTIYTEGDSVWCGTDRGLYLVSRSSLDTIKLFNTSQGLGEKWVFDIISDNQYLWIATGYGGGCFDYCPNTGGISRYDKHTGEILNFQQQDTTKSNTFLVIADQGQYLLTGGVSGLFRFKKTNGTFTRLFPSQLGSVYSMSVVGDSVWAISYDMVGHTEKLFLLNSETTQIIKTITLPYDRRPASVIVMDNKVYVTRGNSFYILNDSLGQLEKLSHPFLPDNWVNDVEISKGELFAPCNNFAMRLNLSNDSLEGIDLNIFTRAIKADDSLVTVATDGGLYLLNRSNLSVKNIILPNHAIYDIVPDSNYQWLPTNYGLIRRNIKDESILNRSLAKEVGTFGEPRILSLLPSNGVVWISFRGQQPYPGHLITGILKIDRENLNIISKKIISIGDYTQAIGGLALFNDTLFTSGNAISIVDKDSLIMRTFILQKASKLTISNDKLWAIVPNGVHIYDPSSGKLVTSLTENEGLLSKSVFDIEFQDNYVWFASYGGLGRLRTDEIISTIDLSVNPELPDEQKLLQNYPNPFNPTTIISFSVPKRTSVRLHVYDAIGRLVATLVDEELGAGNYSVQWNGTDRNGSRVSSGVYFYRLQSDTFTETKKLLLLR